MRLSHSKLSTLISNPKKYKAIYKIGLSLKTKKPALTIGSSVHYGIENNTIHLDEFFKNEGNFYQANNFTFEQLLSECMVGGYFKHKDTIFKELLYDSSTGEQLELLEEIHELELIARLPSRKGYIHNFLGIIDLLILTEKGFIIVDYKTSKNRPNYEDYLEQLYRYIFIVSDVFPDVPIYKLAIINIRKAQIRQKKNESESAFRKRLEFEYELNDEAYISTHIYTPDMFNKDLMDRYINNLIDMADYAEHIDKYELYWWNYGDNVYGKSEYYDICHNIKDSYILFNVKDTIFDENNSIFLELRDAKEIDMLAINNDNILNKFIQYEIFVVSYYILYNEINQMEINNFIKEIYITDDDLLNSYWDTLIAKIIYKLDIELNEFNDEFDEED